MSNAEVRDIFNKVVKEYGPFTSRAEEVRRCRSLLMDFAGSYLLEINLLMRALEFDVPRRLARTALPLPMVLPQIAKELEHEHGISSSNALWAVECWAFATGLITSAQATGDLILESGESEDAICSAHGPMVAPHLTAANQIAQLGYGHIIKVAYSIGKEILVIATGGAVLFGSDGTAIWKVDCPTEAGALSPDGKMLALAYKNDILLWDISGRRFLVQLEGHESTIRCVTFSPDGKVLASAGGDDEIVGLWDVTSQRLRNRLGKHGGRVGPVAFSPDGNILAVGCADKIALWDTSTGRQLSPLRGGFVGRVSAIDFSVDGQMLSSGSSEQIVLLWDVPSRQLLRWYHPGRRSLNTFDLSFAPSGNLLAVGANDTYIRLWNVSNKRPKTALYGINFYLDGSTVALTQQGSSAVPIDDPDSPRLIDGHTTMVGSVSFRIVH